MQTVQTSGGVSRPGPAARGDARPTGTRKIGAWLWTEWPTWPMPAEAWLVAQAQARGARWVDDYHRKREQAIANEKHDPLRFGWEAPPLGVARALLAGTYVPGKFGPTKDADGGWVGSTHGRTAREDARPTVAQVALPPADDLLLMTGNRFGKSNFGGKLANERMQDTLNARVRCWSQSIHTSRSVQQTAVYKHLRPELRKLKRVGQFCKISYTAATGFTEETLLFPQSDLAYAQTWFLTYHSWQQDSTIAEGPGVTLTWCDEEVPADLIETLRYRVGDTSKMILLLTFTPITGYTDAVGQYIEGARVLECVPARRIVYDWWKRDWSWGEWLLPADKVLVEGLPPGHVPLVLQHTQIPTRYTLCAATAWNPYVDVEEVFSKAANQPLETKLIRWFGWPLRKVRPALTFYDAHIVPPENIPPLSELTIYLAVDPCPPPRNWFMVWLGVDREGRIWVLAEWPDLEVGEWAIPGTEPDGKPGPGAYESGGRGFDGYKLLILEREGWVVGGTAREDARPTEEVWQPGKFAIKVRPGDRLLDPRAASWKVPSQQEEEAKSYIDCLFDPVVRVRAGKRVIIAPGLDFIRAPGAHIQEGNELINDWLTQGWDAKEKLTPMNAPRFYINRGVRSEELEASKGVHPFLRNGCGNTIWAMRTFTGRKKTGGPDENSACKDPIDCLKACAKAGVRYIAPGALGAHGRSFGY